MKNVFIYKKAYFYIKIEIFFYIEKIYYIYLKSYKNYLYRENKIFYMKKI